MPARRNAAAIWPPPNSPRVVAQRYLQGYGEDIYKIGAVKPPSRRLAPKRAPQAAAPLNSPSRIWAGTNITTCPGQAKVQMADPPCGTIGNIISGVLALAPELAKVSPCGVNMARHGVPLLCDAKPPPQKPPQNAPNRPWSKGHSSRNRTKTQ